MLASPIAIVFSLTGIVFGLLIYTRNGVPPIELFRYFTIDMNLFGAVGAGMIVPYAVEGIRKKRFSCPRWTAKLYYVGTSRARIRLDIVAILNDNQCEKLLDECLMIPKKSGKPKKDLSIALNCSGLISQ